MKKPSQIILGSKSSVLFSSNSLLKLSSFLGTGSGQFPGTESPYLGGSSSLMNSSGVVRAGVSCVGGPVGRNISISRFFDSTNLAELSMVFSFIWYSGYIDF
jgi:hypothetical protein